METNWPEIDAQVDKLVEDLKSDPTIYTPDQVDQIGIGGHLYVHKEEYEKLWNFTLRRLE